MDEQDIVIHDTVTDLSRLLVIDDEEMRQWFNSLGDEEARQLAKVCSRYIGMYTGVMLVRGIIRGLKRRNEPKDDET